MVLLAGGNSEAIPNKEVTPFQNWFNKNQTRLASQFSKKKNIITDKVTRDLKDEFMEYAQKQYDKKK